MARKAPPGPVSSPADPAPGRDGGCGAARAADRWGRGFTRTASVWDDGKSWGWLVGIVAAGTCLPPLHCVLRNGYNDAFQLTYISL